MTSSPLVAVRTKSIPMGELMTLILLTYYKMYCPVEEQDEELMQTSINDMVIYLGLDKKLPPIGVIT